MPIGLSELVGKIIRSYLSRPLLIVAVISGGLFFCILTWLDHSQNLEMVHGNSNLLSQLILAGDSVALKRQISAMAAVGDWQSASVFHKNGLQMASLNDGLGCPNRTELADARGEINGHLCFERSLIAKYAGVFSLLFLFYSAIAIALTVLIKKTARELLRISGRFEEISEAIANNLPMKVSDFIVKEEEHLSLRFNEYLAKENEFQQMAIKAEREIVLSKITAQVSHDIRSPLSALNMVIGSLDSVPEEKRLLIRHSVQRINDIANNLLEQSRKKFDGSTISSTLANEKEINFVTEAVLLSPLIDSIVSEKRFQFRDRLRIQIEADLTLGYGLFATLKGSELKRVLSNLINNSVEAFENETGQVIVGLGLIPRTIDHREWIGLTVLDNGKGIPPHILAKLGDEGVSYGKEGTQSGSGLGIYHAKATLESFGGTLDVESHLKDEALCVQGTKFTLTIPKAEPPHWFATELLVEEGTQIITVDDDQSIHGIWTGRMLSLKSEDHGVQLVSLTSGHSLRESVKSASVPPCPRLYLVDYEFLGQPDNGLDLIESLDISDQSILVTSRFEEKHILERCARLGLKLIPKSMAPFVPIRFAPRRQHYDAVLLDDDSLVHMTWQVEAQRLGKSVLIFSERDSLMANLNRIDKETRFYIDSNLGMDTMGRNIKGEDVAKTISEFGFSNLYLATGYAKDDFPHVSWVKAIVGKDPHFED
jgi:signal transduction histidine kinase